MRRRWRNGWAELAEVCDGKLQSPLHAAIALGMNVLVTNTMLAGKVLVLDQIPRITLPAEDASEFGVRVPYDYRMHR